MKAAVYKGKQKFSVEDLPLRELEKDEGIKECAFLKFFYSLLQQL